MHSSLNFGLDAGWLVQVQAASAAPHSGSGHRWQAAAAEGAAGRSGGSAPTHVEAAAAEHEQGLAGCSCSLVKRLEAYAPLHQQAEAEAGLCAVQDGLPRGHRPPAPKAQHLHGGHRRDLVAAEQGKSACSASSSDAEGSGSDLAVRGYATPATPSSDSIAAHQRRHAMQCMGTHLLHLEAPHAAAAVEEAPQLLLILAGKAHTALVPHEAAEGEAVKGQRQGCPDKVVQG